jgi:hypothetical protein
MIYFWPRARLRQQVEVSGSVLIGLAERIERARQAARERSEIAGRKADDPER